MLTAEGTVVVDRDPKDILEFVLDFERYRLADQKIGRVLSVTRNENRGVVRYSGRLRGIATPVDTQEFTLTPYSRLELRSLASRWPGVLARFEGLFTCELTPAGTRVFHRETFRFKAILESSVERL